VTVANIEADNGAVHVINAVLIPEDVCENDDEYIADLLGSMFITECNLLIDYLMVNYNYTEYEACSWDGQPMFTLGGNVSEICECSCQDIEPATTTVVDIIVGSESHNTLEAAVIAAGLDDDLSSDGPFTVFAPTDDAFDALPAGTVETLLEDPTGQLADILLHHVYAGNAMSTDLSNNMMIPTLLGTELMVTIDGNGVMIDNAMVTVANIEADNGVVHVINAVLIPDSNSSIFNHINMSSDEYLYTVDLMGRVIRKNDESGIFIDIFKSGKSVKKSIIK